MKPYLLITLALFIGYNTCYCQTVYEMYPNSNSCSRSVTIDAGDTVWTGSSSSGLQKCFNDTCIAFNISNSGIAGNNCQAVSTDSSGNIWAGTRNGISVFNHQTWNTYTTQNSGLPNDTISFLYHTNSGTWIGSQGGLTYFDGTNWTTYSTQNSGIFSNIISDIAVNNNAVYTAHNNLGLSKFENNTWTTWNVPAFHVEVAAGRIWISKIHKNVQFLDQGIFIKYDSLLNQYSPRTAYYSFNKIQLGLIADPSGNLLFIETVGNASSIVKISPALQITSIKISGIPTWGVYLRTVYKDDNLWGCAFMSGLRHVYIDTTTFKPLLSESTHYLDINNSTVRLLNRGDMHWDPVQQTPKYFSDTWTMRKPVFCSAIWLGGIDQLGQLHTAAQTYRQLGANDFHTGTLDTITGLHDSANVAYYDRFWKIDYDMIQGFLINYQNGNLQSGAYTLPEAIATWPAHGSGNHTRKLAPFIDANNDGVYNPYDGDYPELTGHQMLWWVFNDTMSYPHTQTQGAAFGFEIQGKAYGYNCNLNSAVDEVMNNTTFYQYKITNRSQNTYHDMHIGLWTDFDLGNAADDYVGCDSMLNTYSCWNGDNDDDGGGGYGLNPPMMNVSVLKGPLAIPADGLDNDHDGITDENNETCGLSSFRYFSGMGGVPDGEPNTADDYYEIIQGLLINGAPVTFGENGTNPANPPTKYMYSGTPFIISPSNWTMVSAGWQPDDMRGVGGSGPFTIAPGETQTIDFAYIFTRDSINPNGLNTSVAKNTADVQKIINGFNSGNYPCLTSVGLPASLAPAPVFQLYPNPATHLLHFNKEMLGANYEMYSVTGQLIRKGIYNGTPIKIEDLSPQLYIVRAVINNYSISKRFVKF